MNKQDIKNMLISMRNNENEAVVNNLLGQIDIMNDESISKAIRKIGNKENMEEVAKNFFEKMISKRQQKEKNEKYPINDMFTYGVSENTIHLHLPGDLHSMVREKGIRNAMDIVNLNLLDAISRLQELKQNGFHRLQEKDSIYMISPILIGKELEFLKSIGFDIHNYSKKDLKDDKFVQENPEALLAIRYFGKDKNIGTAFIKLDKIGSKEWQEVKKQKIEEFAKKGITIEENYQQIDEN